MTSTRSGGFAQASIPTRKITKGQKRNLQEDVLDLVFEKLEEILCSEPNESRQPKEETETSNFSLNAFLARIDELALSINALDKESMKGNVEKVLEKYVEDLECFVLSDSNNQSDKDALDNVFEWMEEVTCKHMDREYLGKATDRDMIDDIFERIEGQACADEVVDSEHEDNQRFCMSQMTRPVGTLRSGSMMSGCAARTKCLEVGNLLSLSESADDVRSEAQSLYKISEEPSDCNSTEEISTHSRTVSSNLSRPKEAAPEKVAAPQPQTIPTQIDFRSIRGTVHSSYSKQSILNTLSKKIEETLAQLQGTADSIDIDNVVTCNAGSCHASMPSNDINASKSILEGGKQGCLVASTSHLSRGVENGACKREGLDEDEGTAWLLPLADMPMEAITPKCGNTKTRENMNFDTIDGRVRTPNDPMLGTIDGRVRPRMRAADATVGAKTAESTAKQDSENANLSLIDATSSNATSTDASSNAKILETLVSVDSSPRIATGRSCDSSLPPSSASDDDSYFKWDETPVRSWGCRSSRRVIQANSLDTVKHANRTPPRSRSPLPRGPSGFKRNANFSSLLHKDSSTTTTTSLDRVVSVSIDTSCSNEAESQQPCESSMGLSDETAYSGKPFDEADEDSLKDPSFEYSSSEGSTSPSNSGRMVANSEAGFGLLSKEESEARIDAACTSSLGLDKKPTEETETSEEDPVADPATPTIPADIEDKQGGGLSVVASGEVTGCTSDKNEETFSGGVVETASSIYTDASEGLMAVPSLDIVRTASAVTARCDESENVPDAETLSYDDTEWASLQEAVGKGRISTVIEFNEAVQGDHNPALKMLLVIMWMSMSFLLDVNGKVNSDFEKKRKEIQKDLLGKESVTNADIISAVRKHVSTSSSGQQ